MGSKRLKRDFSEKGNKALLLEKQNQRHKIQKKQQLCAHSKQNLGPARGWTIIPGTGSEGLNWGESGDKTDSLIDRTDPISVFDM